MLSANRIFSRDLVETGRHGGLKAARMLTDAIKQDMAESSNYKLWIFCFLNRRGVHGPLRVTESDFNWFISGFNCAGAYCFTVDVGQGKELADDRVRSLLIEETRSLHTSRVYFGGATFLGARLKKKDADVTTAGCHDNGYATTLNGLITDGLGSKLALLPGYVAIAARIRELDLPSLEIPGLFQANTSLALGLFGMRSPPTSPKSDDSRHKLGLVTSLDGIGPTSPKSVEPRTSGSSNPSDWRQRCEPDPPRYLDPNVVSGLCTLFDHFICLRSHSRLPKV
jgi:hypothetical protein